MGDDVREPKLLPMPPPIALLLLLSKPAPVVFRFCSSASNSLVVFTFLVLPRIESI